VFARAKLQTMRGTALLPLMPCELFVRASFDFVSPQHVSPQHIDEHSTLLARVIESDVRVR
jgi:hypothetical protein